MSVVQTAESLAPFMADTAVKATLLLTLASVATLLMRRSSAAMRHAVWSLTMISLIVLPLASVLLPSWAIPILPATEMSAQSVAVAEVSNPVLMTQDSAPQPDVVEERTPRRSRPGSLLVADYQTVSHSEPVGSIPGEQPQAATGFTVESMSWTRMISVLIWAAGVLVSGLILVRCVVTAVMLRRRSTVIVDGDWCRLLAELSQRLRLTRSVEIHEHSRPIVPLTWGVFRPAVLLPEQACKWTEPMKRSVLLHELAHVRRNDVACQMLGRIACTLFWFHPLAWYGLRRLRQEGEQACDDAVVRSGEKASDYAEQLLRVAHRCCVPRGLSLGVAMAEGNSLEVRVKSLFDTGRSHGPIGSLSLFTLLVAWLLTVAVIVMARPVSATASIVEEVSGELSQQPAAEIPPPAEPEPSSPPEPSANEQAAKAPLKDVIWWKKVDGLQAGFLLDSPAIPNQRVPYNSVAKYRILVRNTAAKDIRFVVRLLPHEGVDAPFLIPSDNITESLAAPKLPERFRAEGVVRRFKRSDPAYVVRLAPGEAVFVPGHSGLDELSLFVGDTEERKHPTAAKIRPGLNWIVQPLQIQLFPAGGFPGGTSLLGRYKITRVSSNGVAHQESANRMVAVPGGTTLYPRIQLDVGTLTAAAVRNAKDAVWGKVDKGLQCGIRMINPKRAYVVGDTLEAEFFWRNTSDATIWSPLPRQFDLYPIVTNAQGQELSVDFGARTLLPAINLPFKAGKVRSLGVSKITLVKEGTPSPRSNIEQAAHLSVGPGTYKLSGSGGISAPDGGRPRSGTISFVVISREPVPKSNLKQKQKVAKARIEELGGEVRPYDETTVAVTLWKTKATDKDLELRIGPEITSRIR